MDLSDSVNLQSLSIVRDELVVTIEDAARSLEDFVVNNHEEKSLQACIDCIKQIRGSLSLLQLSGAKVLADELYESANNVTPADTSSLAQQHLDVISSTFFVLSRYLEYVQHHGRQVPALLIPHMNDLRQLRAKPLFTESHFTSISVTGTLTVPSVDKPSLNEKVFKTHIRRLRCMYQIGFLSLIKGEQKASSLKMMQRACNRILQTCGHDQPKSELWWLAQCTFEAMHEQDMSFFPARSIVLSRIDREIYSLEKDPTTMSALPDEALTKELSYLLLLSGHQSDEITKIKQEYGLPDIKYNDRDLDKERNRLRGPSAHTVASLAKILREELANIKKVLESSSQAAVGVIDDLDGFIGSLLKVADILGVVGLKPASDALKDEIKSIESWRSLEDGPEQDALLQVADTLLYVDSSVSALESSCVDADLLQEATEIAKKKIIAASELSHAKTIVLEECQAGIMLTKRAISSFSETDFDVSHISNIAKTLHSVRGGLFMLKKQHAADLMFLCASFVEDVLSAQENHPAAIKELLETFADAIVTLEFYIDSANHKGSMNEAVLSSAEENLAALGYKIEK